MASVVPGALKAFLSVLLWGLFVFWVVEWFLFPTDRWTTWKADAIQRTNSKFLELNGPFFVLWSFPVVAFALIALLYMEVDRHCTKRDAGEKVVPKWKQVWRRISRGMWSQPILVRTPLGVLTGIDLLAISLVLFATLWIFFKPLIPALKIVDQSTMEPGIQRWMIKVGRVGTWTGRAWYLPMALLFIPVSRNSPFLRLVNISFEHAVRFHRWVGHFSLVILLLHSITFALHIYYTGSGMKDVLEWKRFGVSNLAGIISMLAGVVLWVTSLGPIRRYFFNVFYFAHHMYIVVFAFAVWHVGDFASFYFLAGVLLFFIDKFIRMVQSQSPVSILSAKVLSNGVVELKFPKSPELKYSALGFIFINVPGISRFQWHPFSTTSSSLQGDDIITICIKPLGEWTRNLQELIIAADSKLMPKDDTKSGGCPLALQLFAEGPYGPEKDYFLHYRTLVLVAGGVGVTPFLAVIRDLLCRYNQQSSQGQLPTEVHLIWCVPRKSDVATLRDLQPAVLFPGFAGGPLHIKVKAFVTREQHGGNEEKIASEGGEGQEYAVYNNNVDEVATRRKAVRDVRGSNLWMAAVIAVSVAGFILFLGIFHNYVVRPNHHSDATFFYEHGGSHTADHGRTGKPFPTWATVSLLFIAMFLGVVVCGGAVLFAWSKFGTKSAMASSAGAKRGPLGAADLETNAYSLLDQASITAGSRPVLSELLNAVAAGSVGHDVGVLVSGPTSMVESVASACRGYNFRHVCGGTQLQYHSISFDF